MRASSGGTRSCYSVGGGGVGGGGGGTCSGPDARVT